MVNGKASFFSGITCDSNGQLLHNSMKKMPLDEDEDELDDMDEGEPLHALSDAEEHDEHEDDLDESMRDAADEFEQRVMRAIERNIKRTISENDVAIDMYDNETVLV